MNDIEKRIAAAIERITSGHASMRVPAEETDPDLVLADCLAEIRRLRALTPPAGYVPATAVLGTATRLRRLASAASPLGRKAYIKAAEDIEMTVSAARPEVSP